MQPFYTKAAAFAAMPLMAAGGYAGYNYYNDYSHQYPSQNQMVCTTLNSDLYYGYSNNSNDVARLQQFFIAYGYLRGQVNGQFNQATMRAVQNFQSNQGLQVTGNVDSQTRSRIQQISCNGNNNGGWYPNQGGQLSVQGIDAPSSLRVGQSGSFTVRVNGWNTYNGGQLHYRVVWGDENNNPQATAYYGAQTVNSSGTFTHTYVTAGTYTVRFTVTDDYGHSTQASATVRVTGSYYGGYTGDPVYYNPGTNCSNYYDRNCYNSGYTNGNYNNGYGSGVTCASYYDRNCYQNGQYIGPNYGGGATYNGPGDTCYFLNGQWQGNCGSTNYNSNYNNGYYNNGGYTNTIGGPNGPDYSCYYDRACLAQMQGRSY